MLQGFFRQKISLVLAIFMMAGGLAGCASEKPATENDDDRAVAALYDEAATALKQRNYITAAKLFDDVERQHPYSAWAAQSQLMAAYAHYRKRGYDDAIATLNRFIQLHPGHKNVAYAYYLKAICLYDQISDVRRDQSMTRLTLESLQEVLRRFPDTDYAKDARFKLDLTRDHLAAKEMDVGRYYQRIGHYLAAINRFKVVAEKYDTSTHTQEALTRLVECYLALGLDVEAQKAAAILGYNYPGGVWYKSSYDRMQKKADLKDSDPSFWDDAVDWMF